MARDTRPIEDLPDADLLSESLDRSTLRVPAWGCYSVFFGYFVVVLLIRGAAGFWSTIASAFCPASVLAFLVMAGCFWITNALHRARSAPFLREYLRRHGVSADASTRGLPADGKQEVVVIVSGRGLPHGGGRAVWVALSRGATCEGTLVHASTPGEHGNHVSTSGEAALSPTTAEEIAAAIDAAAPATKLPDLRTVRDGFPFSVTIHRADSSRPLSFDGNLCANNWRDHAGARLADAILRAADAVGAAQQPFGACDSRGDVTLGDR
ncbi:MAG: hypothetical protein K8T90_07750 [Planctomycetes bacterium]|nr:hypothetical protein [Planctomycetota bacterium]